MKPAPVNPAAASTNPALVPLLTLGATALALAPQHTNTLALVQATQEAPAPPATASIQNVLANLATNGKMVVVRNKHRMEQLASCIIAMARWLAYVLRVWTSMSR
mgnify:CR=1 FL=1